MSAQSQEFITKALYSTGSQRKMSEERSVSFSDLRRFSNTIFVAAVVAAIIGASVGAIRRPTYTSVAQVLVTANGVQYTQQELLPVPQTLDSSALQNQIEIIRSDNTLMQVADELPPDVLNRIVGSKIYPAWAEKIFEPASDVLNRIVGSKIYPAWAEKIFEPASEDSIADHRARMLAVLGKKISVRRLSNSDVIEIKGTAFDPKDAAKLTNAVMTAYAHEQNALRSRNLQGLPVITREKLKSLGVNAHPMGSASEEIKKNEFGVLATGALFGLCGLILSIGRALLKIISDGTIQTPEQAADAVGAELLGTVRIPPTSDKHRFLFFKCIFSRRSPSSHTLFGFGSGDSAQDLSLPMHHTLRNIGYAALLRARDQPFVLAITSARPFDASGALARGLARVLANESRRVLLIDMAVEDGANRGVSQNLLSIPALDDEVSKICALARLDNDSKLYSTEGTDFIASLAKLGPNDTTRVISEMRKRFCCVIVRLPESIPDSWQTRHITALADMIIFAVKLRSHFTSEVKGAAEKERIRGKVLGVVVDVNEK